MGEPGANSSVCPRLASGTAVHGGHSPGIPPISNPFGRLTFTALPAASQSLVLSLFPGAGLLDRGFEQAGFCVVRGPDTVFGQCIEIFSAPAGHFTGVFGGPPCQDFSRARRRPPTGHGERMLRHFARLVTEANPDWWLLENVPGVPDLAIPSYRVQRFNLFAWEFGCRQSRKPIFPIWQQGWSPFGHSEAHSVTVQKPGTGGARKGRAPQLRRAVRAPRVAAEFRSTWSVTKRQKPVQLATECQCQCPGRSQVAIRDRKVTPLPSLCRCGCGRPITGKQVSATAACRKRLERSRRGQLPRGILTPGSVT